MKKGPPPLLALAIMLAADLALVNLAFVVAYWMRYTLSFGGEVRPYNYVSFSAYSPIEATYTVIVLLAFAVAGLYRRSTRAYLADEIIAAATATAVGVLLTLAIVFLYQGYAYSRLLFFFLGVVTLVLVVLARSLKHLYLAYLRRKGIGVKRALVVGGDRLGHMIMHVIATEPGMDYQLVGFVEESPNGNMGRFQSLGCIDDLERLLCETPVDEVIIALPSSSAARIAHVARCCRQNRVTFKIVPDLYQLSLSRIDVNDLRGVPLIGLKDVSIQGFNMALKRAFDTLTAAALLLLLSPVWLACAAAIKLNSRGPVLFKQARVGKNGSVFQVYKFRSMREGAERELVVLADKNEATGPLFKMKNDPRITGVGRFLRRTSLDELPQLLNVLRGEMSMVGPRPPIPSEVEKYESWHRRRLEVAPGITGLWQVSGRSDIPFDEMVMLDIYYIENWSLSLDLRTILRTIPAVLTAKGAY